MAFQTWLCYYNDERGMAFNKIISRLNSTLMGNNIELLGQQ